MFELFLYSILVVVILTPCGRILSGNNNLNITNLSSELIYGIILISFISLALNFLIALNPIVNTIILILPILILYKNYKYYFSKLFLKFLVFNSILIFLLIVKSNIYRPDAMLYHLPYTSILNEEKIIFGLSNLHFRFGHISIIQYFSAFFNNLIFNEKAIVFSAAIIASTTIINFFNQILNYFKKKQFNFHFFYLFSILIFIFYKMNRYGEYGNDAPTHFLFFFLISEIIKSLNNNQIDLSNNFILSIFILLNKITMSFGIILPFLFLTKKKFFKLLKNKKFYFGIIFLGLWLLKNTIISGCLIFPVSKLCFSKLSWTNIEQVEYVADENEAWTKSWPDFKNTKNISQKNYSKKFNWIKTWSETHLKKIIKIIFPYIAFLIIIYLFLYSKNINKKKYDNKPNGKYLIITAFIFIFSIIWFLKVPVYRYGYSYFISLIALIFSYFCISLNIVQKSFFKFLKYTLIFFLVIFISKNSIRIFKYDTNEKEVWPKIIFINENDVKKIKLNDFYYYESIRECGFSFTPCTHYKNLKLKSKIYLNYNFIYNN